VSTPTSPPAPAAARRRPAGRSAAALAALAVLAPGRASAQVPEGHALLVQAAPASSPALAWFDFLRRQATRVVPLAPLPIAVERVALGAASGDVLLAGASAAGAELFAGRLHGASLTGATRFATGLTGAVAGIAPLADGRWLVATRTNLWLVPPGGGPAQPLLPPATAPGCVDVVAGRGRVAVLGAVPQGGSVIFVVDVVTAAVTQHRLALGPATAIAASPRGVVIADAAGELFEVDDAYAVTPYARPGLGPVQGLLYDPFRKRHVLGYDGELRLLDGNGTSPPLPLPPGRVLDLDLAPHLSAFAVYGAACAGSAGLPQLGAVGTPHPGNDGFALTLAQALALAPAAVVLGGGSADLDLGGLGMDGCRLLAQPLLVLPASIAANGRALVALPIPPDPALIGGVAFTQFAVVDRGANRGGAAWSAGGRIRV
jgi:hypothetical protein